ncbi:hypothetical protein V5O48_016433, partial [Marasmius crinis-equi]
SLPQTKKPKPRGKAKKPPSLFSKAPTLSFDDCVTGQEGNMTINIAVNIYPPRAPDDVITALGLPHYYVRYVRHQDSFNAVMSNLGLYHEVVDVPLATPLMTVLDLILQAVKDHGYAFQDVQSAITNLAPHERHPLQMLSFTNQGRPNGRNKACRLIVGAFPAGLTIGELLTKPEFANPKLSITYRKYLELNAVIRPCHYPLPINASLATMQLGIDPTEKIHRCVSNRVYSLFRDDTDIDESMGMVREEDLEEECGEEHQESDDQEEEVVEQTLTHRNSLRISNTPAPALRTIQTRQSSAPSAPSSSTSTSTTPPTPQAQRSVSAPGPSNSESTHDATRPIWTGTPWEEEPDHSMPTIYNFERTGRIFELFTEEFTRNNEDRPPVPLSIRGRSVEEMSNKLRMIILRCLFNKDFGQLLSLDREFKLVDDNDRAVSSGNGVETEVFHKLFHSYFVERKGEFFAPLTDLYCTLATTNGPSSQWMSTEQKRDWGVLGVLCAMSLIYGHGTDPLNPLLLIYLINDCNLNSLRSDVVLRLDPHLHSTLKAWNEIIHTDDVSSFSGHFLTFHDTQISTLRTRSDAQHNALGWEMLHNGVIGPRAVNHPVFEHFLKGFRLPCARGYSLTQIARAFRGGVERFVSTVYANYIASYSDLPLRHVSRLKPETEEEVIEALSTNPSLEAANFEDMFKEFLEDIGYPSLDLMEAIKDRFNPVVNLQGIFDSSFRLRMFAWAATGAPFASTDGVDIKVVLIEDDDGEYASGLSPAKVQSNLNAGVCKFRTCAREIRIPASFLVHLLSINYEGAVRDAGGSTRDESGAGVQMIQNSGQSQLQTVEGLTVRQAVHHWLLASILDNIGQNNVA